MIPVLTTPLPPAEVCLYPMHPMAVDSDWNRGPNETIGSIVEALSKIGEQAGVTAFYNLKLEPRYYHGSNYMRGTADAYRNRPWPSP